MNKIRTYKLLLVLTILSLLGTACNSEGQLPVTGESTTPNITLNDLLQELNESCFIHNIEGDKDPLSLEVAIDPGCEEIVGLFDYGDDVGKVNKRKIYIRDEGATTNSGLEVRPTRQSGLEFCGPGEQTLLLSFGDGMNVSVYEALPGQTMGVVQPNQKLTEVCVKNPSKER